MSNYPEDVKPIVPHHHGAASFTRLSVNPTSGITISAVGRRFKLYAATLVYPRRNWTDFASQEVFLESMRGADGRFTFTDFNGWDKSPVGKQWYSLYVGVTDGTASTHDVPMKYSTSKHLYLNGVEKTIVSDWTFSSGTGTDGKDSITFTGAQTAGQLITWTAVGRRSHRCRLLGDNLDWDSHVGMTTTPVTVQVVEAPIRA